MGEPGVIFFGDISIGAVVFEGDVSYGHIILDDDLLSPGVQAGATLVDELWNTLVDETGDTLIL